MLVLNFGKAGVRVGEDVRDRLLVKPEHPIVRGQLGLLLLTCLDVLGELLHMSFVPLAYFLVHVDLLLFCALF